MFQTTCAQNRFNSLANQNQDGHDRLITTAGKKCNAAEKSYGSTKGEMAALVYGVSRFEHYLNLNKFIIRTDNKSLTYLAEIKSYQQHLVTVGTALTAFQLHDSARSREG